MKEIIADFQGLEEHMKNSAAGFRESIIGYYKTLGEKHGFTIRENSSVIKHGVNFGKLDLMWLEPNIAFSVEFGPLGEVLASIWKLCEIKPEMAVLVMSSKSGCKPESMAKLIRGSELTTGMRNRFMVLDIAEKKIAYEPETGA
jgi:hypothetical protein